MNKEYIKREKIFDDIHKISENWAKFETQINLLSAYVQNEIDYDNIEQYIHDTNVCANTIMERMKERFGETQTRLANVYDEMINLYNNRTEE